MELARGIADLCFCLWRNCLFFAMVWNPIRELVRGVLVTLIFVLNLFTQGIAYLLGNVGLGTPSGSWLRTLVKLHSYICLRRKLFISA